MAKSKDKPNNNHDNLIKCEFGTLVCKYMDGLHSVSHTFEIPFNYDKNLDPDEIICMLAKEAEAELYKLGNEKQFISGFIYYMYNEPMEDTHGEKNHEEIRCDIGYVDGKYVFYEEKEVMATERKTFFRQKEQVSRYWTQHMIRTRNSVREL